MGKYLLGVESTAHTFGIAVLDYEGKILSNVKDTFTTADGEGGMIPNKVAEHHNAIADSLYQKALDEAKINEEDLIAVAFSNAPGLAPCLLEGLKFAKKLNHKLKIPLVEVNHCIAHLEIGETTGAKDPVLLYASGANTQIIAYEAGKYRIFGETLDLGVGNFIDTFARYLGLGFPGGPKIQKIAEQGKNFLELPYSIKGMDVSFSGIQTKLKQLYEKSEDKEQTAKDLAFSMQETVFAMLVEASERALAHTGKKEFLLGGGVACNTRLQEMCKKMCEARGVKYFCPPMSLLVDNAGMIGYLGLKIFKKSKYKKDVSLIDIDPKERTDEVVVNWK
jgi:N6-L-threonylcarbamoyladenine synthase